MWFEGVVNMRKPVLAVLGAMLGILMVVVPVTNSAVATPSGPPSESSTDDAGPNAGTKSETMPHQQDGQQPMAAYSPRRGVMFSSANNKTRTRIQRHIAQSIRSTPRRATIRVFSWNIDSKIFTDALIAAHRKRNNIVRVIMADSLARQSSKNSSYRQLKRALARNGNRPRSRHSWMKTCVNSCRGGGGSAHNKFVMLSKAGKSRRVIINSSGNLTASARTNQFNDAYTLVDNRPMYGKFKQIFNQSRRDRRVRVPFQTKTVGNQTAMFMPYVGPGATGDPILKVLSGVKCRGARNSGINGRTAVRVGQSALIGDRGIALARRIKRIWDAGCNVRLLTSEIGPQVQSVLNGRGGRGRVPWRQYVQDYDSDGYFDRYIHMKALTINGHYRKSRRKFITVNGTANWSESGIRSDEVLFRVADKRMTHRYQRRLSGMFQNPISAYTTALGEANAKKVDDPFKYVEVN